MLHQLYQGGGVSSERQDGGLYSAFKEPVSVCEPQSITVRSKYSPAVISSEWQDKKTPGITLVPKLK